MMPTRGFRASSHALCTARGYILMQRPEPYLTGVYTAESPESWEALDGRHGADSGRAGAGTSSPASGPELGFSVRPAAASSENEILLLSR